MLLYRIHLTGWNTNSKRFSGGHRESVKRRGQGRDDWAAIEADDKPFDPTPWLVYPEVILFGCNHFGQALPVGTTLVWIKRLDGGFGSFLSDAELAWQKGGRGVYCRRDTSLMAQTRDRSHPTEKPVSLMQWCLGRLKGPGLVMDPYMGSGSTGVACARMGIPFVGIEIQPQWFARACCRIYETICTPDLFVQAKKSEAFVQKSMTFSMDESQPQK